jgi:hypothetical protein
MSPSSLASLHSRSTPAWLHARKEIVAALDAELEF